MSLKPQPKPAGDKAARVAATPIATRVAAGKSRPARKLFQPEAKPLESGLTPLLALRRPRRNSRPLAVLAACLALAGACPAQETNATHDPVVVTNRAELEETVEREAAMVAQQMVQTNDVAQTNSPGETNAAAGLTVAPNPAEPTGSGTESTRNDRRSSRDREWRRDRQRSDSSRPSGNSSTVTLSNTGAVSPQVPGKTVEGFTAFNIIGDRNIFNPNRSPRRTGGNEPRPKVKVVDSFGLVGILAYEKGTFAFFDGSASEFKKVLKVSDQIAGYTIAEVSSASVKLNKDGKTLEVPVGSQMRREEQGDWTLSMQQQTYAASPSAASTSNTTSAPAGAGGDADEVLKRLMQRREQE
jgi:hypothetical protein